MNRKEIVFYLSSLFCSVMLFHSTIYSQSETNYVDSEVHEYIGNGAWCWFQDERAVVDAEKGKLVIGSANTRSGVDLIIFDINSKTVGSTKFFGGLAYTDDHNSPGVVIAPNGNYIALWNHHYDKYNTRYSIYNGQEWSSEKRFDWTKIPGGTDFTICYSNVYYLSAEDRMYNFARANDRAPNFIYSDDNGNTWQFGGQITTNNHGGYNKGYYKYWGNGVDRIDIVLTEAHPREMGTSIFHGYIKDHKLYNSKGTVADSDIYDRGHMASFDDFTKVFQDGTKINGITMGRCWQHDIARYDDGTIAILFKARANNSELDHRNFYARYDGNDWKITYIGKAGQKMYSSEQDYTGLGALCPDDPNRIYLSTPFNPGNDNSTPKKREIWRGTTTDNGATWSWEAVTANSTVDNFRPIVPKWEPGKEALLWWRGTYQTAQRYNASVVGTFYDYNAPFGFRVSVETSGRGTVTKTPSMGAYPQDTTVVLTAEPRSGWGFSSWSGDIKSEVNPLTITVDTNISITAEFVRTGIDTTELVTNGEFSPGSESWTLNNWGGEGSGSVVSEEYRISISSVGENAYEIQLIQPGINLIEGITYKLSFEAYALRERTLEVTVGQHESPWDKYIDEPLIALLSDTKQSFEIVFEMTDPTDANTRIEFNAGDKMGDVFIDNVSIKEASATPVRTVTRKKNSRSRITSSGITFDKSWNSDVVIKMYSLSGSLVYKDVCTPARGENAIRFDRIHVAEGLYIAKVYSDNITLHTELVHMR